MASRTPPNTLTFVQLTLHDLDQRALRVLWAIKTKTPLQDVGERELKQLFHKGILRQDYDVIGKRDVVLLTGLGKRCIELMQNPDPPDDTPPPPSPPPGLRIQPGERRNFNGDKSSAKRPRKRAA